MLLPSLIQKPRMDVKAKCDEAEIQQDDYERVEDKDKSDDERIPEPATPPNTYQHRIPKVQSASLFLI